MKICFGQTRNASKAQQLPQLDRVASTAFANMRKGQMKERVFYFPE
jgi:hypothetical protein